MASPLVVARSLEHAYRTGGVITPVLRGVDLEIPEGAFAVFVGPSGSGKTTLLNLIGALDRPQAGTLEVAGTALHTATEAERHRFRRDHVAWVFQFFHLVTVLTALENVEIVLEGVGLGRREARNRAQEALDSVGLVQKHQRLPGQLSGGEQQRVAIARAIAKRPRLILADEPTGALDRTLGEEIVVLLDRLRTELGTTVVAVTHDPKVVARGTKVHALGDGRLESAS